jgi:hypothetical protein
MGAFAPSTTGPRPGVDEDRHPSREQPFSLLRLTGARLGMLRRVVALESAIPLLAVAVRQAQGPDR